MTDQLNELTDDEIVFALAAAVLTGDKRLFVELYTRLVEQNPTLVDQFDAYLTGKTDILPGANNG